MRKGALLSLVVLAAFLGLDQPRPPATPKRPVTDVYNGAAVRDDYRWLEKWLDPQVQKWSEAQNNYACYVLDGLPGREAIERRGPGAREVSLDGKLVAVSLSEGGSESGTVRVFDAATGKPLPDVIPRVNGGTAGGSLAWNGDATGFFYTRYPRAGERPPEDMDFYQQIWFHRLGARPEDDAYSLGKDFPRIAETTLRSSDDGRAILASVKNGDGGEVAQFLLEPAGTWTRGFTFADKAVDGRFGPDRSLRSE